MAPPRRVRKKSLWHTVHPEQTCRKTSFLGIHSTNIYICLHQILQKRFIYFQCQKINKPPSSTKNEKTSLQNYFPSIECAVLIDSGRAVSSAVEHRLHTAGVTGSSPVLPTMHGAVVKSVITPACHAGGRGFKSLPLRHFLRTSFVEGVLFLCRCRR